MDPRPGRLKKKATSRKKKLLVKANSPPTVLPTYRCLHSVCLTRYHFDALHFVCIVCGRVVHCPLCHYWCRRFARSGKGARRLQGSGSLPGSARGRSVVPTPLSFEENHLRESRQVNDNRRSETPLTFTARYRERARAWAFEGLCAARAREFFCAVILQTKIGK